MCPSLPSLIIPDKVKDWTISFSIYSNIMIKLDRKGHSNAHSPAQRNIMILYPCSSPEAKSVREETQTDPS